MRLALPVDNVPSHAAATQITAFLVTDFDDADDSHTHGNSHI